MKDSHRTQINELPPMQAWENPVNTIYNEDCFELMARMSDELVQLIVTDPPYGIRYQNNFTSEKLPYLIGDEGIDYLTFAQQSYRVLQDNSHAYFFTRFDKYPYHYQCLVQAGFTVKNCMVIGERTGGKYRRSIRRLCKQL